MKSTRVLLSMSLALLMVAGFSSCKKAEPVAKFSFTTNGKTVTFVNESTDATSYTWNFGDQATSTEASPSHTYGDYGLYNVTLKATGDGGDNTASLDVEVLFVPDMVIDGNFAKWTGIATLGEGTQGTLTKIKVTNDEKYLYVYVEGTADLRGFFDMYINSDNDLTTGAQSWYYPTGCGADYLLEGFIAEVGDADLFADDPSTDAWGWLPSIAAGSNLIKASALTTITGGKAIEFSIMREMVANLGTTLHLGFVDVAEDWNPAGSIPLHGTETSALIQYIMK